jgi:hypothetical protein
MIRQKPFAGSWTMEGYAGVAESFLLLLERNDANQFHAKHTELMASAKEACQAMRAFSRIFSIAQPRACRLLGWQNRIAGKHSQANRALQKGIALAEQLVMPYEQARIHCEIGRHAENTIEREVHLQKANDMYTELGVPAKFV